MSWGDIIRNKNSWFHHWMLVRELSLYGPPKSFFLNSGSRKAYLPMRNLYIFLSTKRIVLNALNCVPFSLFSLVAKKLRASALAAYWELPVAYIPEAGVSS